MAAVVTLERRNAQGNRKRVKDLVLRRRFAIGLVKQPAQTKIRHFPSGQKLTPLLFRLRCKPTALRHFLSRGRKILFFTIICPFGNILLNSLFQSLFGTFVHNEGLYNRRPALLVAQLNFDKSAQNHLACLPAQVCAVTLLPDLISSQPIRMGSTAPTARNVRL